MDALVSGRYEITSTTMKVEKADGSPTRFFLLKDGVESEITEAEYDEENRDTSS